jgi:hypothetical protein
MRSLLTFTGLLLLCGYCAAQLTPAAVIEQLQSHQSISGRFQQRRQLQGLPRPIDSSGSFIFWRGQGLYWETLAPFYQATTFTRDETITWLTPAGAAEAAQPGDPAQQTISRVLLAVFSADMAMLERLFESDWRVDGEGGWSLLLTPRNDTIKKAIDHARLEGAGHVRQLQVKTASGDLNTLVFEQVVSPATITPDQCSRFSRQGNSHCPQAMQTGTE